MIKALKKRQADALEQLWKQYSRLLFSLADTYCDDPDEADDIVHDVVLRLTRHIDQLMMMKADDLKRYLAKAIRNEAISHGRTSTRHKRQTVSLDAEMLTQLPGSDNLEEDFLREDEIRSVLELISQLSEKEQTALRMKRLEHASNAQIAAVLGIAESSVGQYVMRAQRKLKTLYHKEDTQ